MQTDTPEVADTMLVNFEANKIHNQTTHKHHCTESGTDGSPAKHKKELQEVSEAERFEEDQE